MFDILLAEKVEVNELMLNYSVNILEVLFNVLKEKKILTEKECEKIINDAVELSKEQKNKES